MKKKVTRLFSVLLAAVLVFGTLPVSALGTDVVDPPASTVDEPVADESAVDESSAEPEEESAVDDAAQVEEQSAEEETVVTYASNDPFYKIVHLDCGRKYFSKDWIIALLYEMKNDGYNQLQLAFGNDGLRFLLDDMSFTVNNTTYAHNTVVSRVEAGNKAQNSSGDASWLMQKEMNEIIETAQKLGIEIVPLLNLPGHANAILDIADDTYNASGSNNTLNVADSADAREFGMAIFKKYVDYFAGKGCRFFSFGADEYANDASGTFSFSRLDDTQYAAFASFINDLAGYIIKKGMTPRAFNDGLYYQNKTDFESNWNVWEYRTMDTDTYSNIKSIQVCYWSSGWNGYYVASASTIANKGHAMINTNGDYYYVLGKDDKFDTGYSDASGFNNTGFSGSTVSNPVGSMFCIWCDYPNDETETEVAQKTRLVLRAMAQRMNGDSVNVDESVIENGFNADGTINKTTDDSGVKISIGDSTETATAGELTVNGTMVLTASKAAVWESSDEEVAFLTPIVADGANAIVAEKVEVKALKAGDAIITATSGDQTAQFELKVQEAGTKNVTVTVNDTETVTVDGNVTGDYTTDKPEIATVKTELVETSGGKVYTPVTTMAEGTYYISTKENDTAPTMQVTITKSGSSYYLQYDGTYYYPNASYSWRNGWSYNVSTGRQTVTIDGSNGAFTASRSVTSGYGYNQQTTTSYLTLSGTTFGASGTETTLYFYKQEDAPATKQTKITFTGKTEGETFVEIGGVKYIINVTKEDLTTVTPLTIEYWITNTSVTADGATSKEIAAKDVYSEKGKKLSELVPESGITMQDHEARLWKGTRHLSDEKQTDAKGDDKTGTGDDYSYIRYWNGAWEFSADGTTWIAFNSDNQVVAYYMQRTSVTDEITTDVVDWGTNVNEVKYTHYVELDFAIQYPNGDRTPTSFPVSYTDEDGNTQWKTMEFHCDSTSEADKNTTVFQDGSYYYRRIGRVNAVETSEYEVYMITLTPTSDSKSEYLSGYSSDRPSTYTYDGTEKVVWVDDEANLGNFKDESLHAAQYHCGGEATVPYIDIYQEHGMLVTYYVRAKATNDSLTVYYVEKNTGDEIYHYNIAVNSPETFKSDIALNKDSEDSWKGPLDNGTVTNSNNKVQTVSADLSTMPEIEASYRYADYKCDEISLSSDHKVLTLYYTFNKTAAFTVDFGVPLNISLADINATLAANAAKITKIDISGETHGKAIVNSDKSITYTPDTRFVGSENGEQLSITYVGNNVNGQENGITYRVYIYPASNVLYEESFLSKGEDDTTWKRTDAAAATQETQKVDDTAKTYNVFGYDGSYSSSTGANGVWSITGLEKNKYSAPLTTEFYGNTFDLIGDCGPTTGGVLLTVIKDDPIKGKHATIANIDTRYDDGTNNTTIHQVPLAHIVMANEKYGYDDALCTVKVYATGLDQIDGTSAVAVQAAPAMDADAEYDALLAQILEENDLTMDDVDFVTISAADNLDVAATPDAVDFYSATYASDGTGSSGYQAGTHVEIDGFRVYRSADKTDAVAANYPEKEQDVSYKNIWDVAKNSFVGFTDKKGEVTGTVQDYIANGGPQNEIYLKKGDDQSHAVVFKIGNEQSTIQVSLRAVKGTGSVTVNLADGEKTITSVTEMYYEVTSNDNGVFTIANTGDGILAIGNVKLPSDVTEITSAQDLGDDMVSKVLTAALYGNPEPDPEPDPATFAPETFETKVSSSTVIRNKVVTLKVTVSSDVAYITVNGKKYTRTGLKGFSGKNRTIRVVSVMPKDETPNFEIVAYNANGEKSETKTVSE